MSVEFDEQGSSFQAQVNQTLSSSDTPKLVGLMMRWGLAKSEEGANKVLIGIAIASFILTIFVIFKFVL